MYKIKNFFRKWGTTVAIIILIFLYLGKGCTNNKLAKQNKTLVEYNDSINSRLDMINVKLKNIEDSQINKDEIKFIMNDVMFDFIIYENDIDKGNLSISEIKNKIRENE